MLEIARRGGGGSDGHREPAGADRTAASSNGSRRKRSSPATEVASPRPFAVELEWRPNGAAIVQPHGELDLATVSTLRAALDGVQNAWRLVLDLRGLSFIDAVGLSLLVALDRRAKRNGVQLALVPPTPPANRAIQLTGLDQVLPFAVARDALDRGQASSRTSVTPQPTTTSPIAAAPRLVRGRR